MNVSLKSLLILTLGFVYVTTGQTQSKNSKQSSAPQTTKHSRWYTLTSPDNDFLIEFPGKPERKEDAYAPGGTSRNYVLVANSVLYQFSYLDTGFNPADYDANQLPPKFGQGLIEHAKENGSTVLRSQLLRINVFEYEVLYPRKGDRSQTLHWIERHVIRYGRQYTLSCGSTIPNQKVDIGICRRFFESFHIVRAPQSR